MCYRTRYRDLEDVMDEMYETVDSMKCQFFPIPGRPNIRVREERLAARLDCDEVYPNVYIGSADTAKNKEYLTHIGITHILNCAEGTYISQIDTGADYYSDHKIKYLGLDLVDMPNVNIKQYFDAAGLFIKDAVNNNGKVLVHCSMGISRSGTCVIAYLMLHKKKSAVKAIKIVRQKRGIRPNPGFMRQLAELEIELRNRSKFAPLCLK